MPPVSSYVGYSIGEPWGRPRVVFGVDAREAEVLAALLDSHEYAGLGSGQVPGPVGRAIEDVRARIPAQMPAVEGTTGRELPAGTDDQAWADAAAWPEDAALPDEAWPDDAAPGDAAPSDAVPSDGGGMQAGRDFRPDARRWTDDEVLVDTGDVLLDAGDFPDDTAGPDGGQPVASQPADAGQRPAGDRLAADDQSVDTGAGNTGPENTGAGNTGAGDPDLENTGPGPSVRPVPGTAGSAFRSADRSVDSARRPSGPVTRPAGPPDGLSESATGRRDVSDTIAAELAGWAAGELPGQASARLAAWAAVGGVPSRGYRESGTASAGTAR